MNVYQGKLAMNSSKLETQISFTPPIGRNVDGVCEYNRADVVNDMRKNHLSGIKEYGDKLIHRDAFSISIQRIAYSNRIAKSARLNCLPIKERPYRLTPSFNKETFKSLACDHLVPAVFLLDKNIRRPGYNLNSSMNTAPTVHDSPLSFSFLDSFKNVNPLITPEAQ